MTSEYIVKDGDNLWMISQANKISIKDLQVINNLDGNDIRPGQRLFINSGPSPKGTKKIIVVTGDTLWQLAQTHSVSIEAIKKANGLASDDIEAGSSLIIPSNNTNTGDLTSLNTKDISNQMVHPNTHDQSPSSSTRDSLSFTKNVLSSIDRSVILGYKEKIDGRSALAEAAHRNLYDCCKVIYSRCPELLWETDIYQSTALNDAASGGYVDIVKFLIGQEERDNLIGKDEGQKLLMMSNKFKYTALHHAANAGQLEAVKALVAADKNNDVLKAVNDAGNTPLHLAVKESRLEVVKYLAGVDTKYVYPLNMDGHTPLYMAWHAAFEHPTQLIRDDVLDVVLNAKDINGKTPLHIATSTGDEGVILPLLYSDKVDNTIPDKFGRYAINSINFYYDKIRSGVYNNKDLMTDKELSEQSAFDLLVAALICTVSFTSGIMVPGGFRSSGSEHEGNAILYKKNSFLAFVISNSFAFALSLYAVFSHFSIKHLRSKDDIIFQLRLATMCIFGSIFALMASFISGSFAVFGVHHKPAFMACVVCFLCFFVLAIYSMWLMKGKKKGPKKKKNVGQ